MAEASGFLNINKPLHMTSHDVVGKIRRGLKLKKVGHAGTLDPLASGVLVICIGGATRLSDYVMHTTKRYRARVYLGATTDTYDAEGSVLQERDASHVQREDVEQVLRGFVGDIQQMPPMYSAIKVGGRKLYDMARAGETIEREKRPVRIDALSIVDWSFPELTLDVTCSSGTYIRSLAFDVGEALGVGAYLSGLVRQASGSFTLENALELNELLVNENWRQYLITPPEALSHWQRLELSVDETHHILHGRPIPWTDAGSETVFGYAPDGRLVAILQADDGLWRPHKVFSEQ
ncbi:MAG: tRNA pseudouridine(55) synthase TruB [Chloroflexi bacterium]|nr:tRNA pseudouridine(55) synthase TruB [Chloroflexota bacterium]